MLYLFMCHDKHCVCTLLAHLIVAVPCPQSLFQMQFAKFWQLRDCASTFYSLILFPQLRDVPWDLHSVQSDAQMLLLRVA